MTLRTALSVIASAGAAAVLVACSRAPAEDFAMISVDEVERMQGAPDVKVFDANTRETFEIGHLPGAAFVDSKTLAASLPQDKSTRLVFYCKNPQ